jgi:hypothetical protein
MLLKNKQNFSSLIQIMNELFLNQKQKIQGTKGKLQQNDIAVG